MATTEINVETIIQDNMLEYSAYVLLDRALPDLRDGLKPVYRRILYSMYLMKATKLTKSANVVGQVMKLHPHGSSYGSVVGMVQKDRNPIPLLEGKGNFGQYSSRDLAPAADRYSEVKLAEIAIDMMKDFEKNIVNFVDNYDGTLKMPEVLPTKFPSILTMAQSGIGVGFSSSTVSFNLNEVCDSVIKFIKTKKHTLLVPDFATGGSIVNEPEVFQSINALGTGSVKLRGKAEIEGNEILITEIPYSTTREAIIEKVIQLAKSGRLKEVTDIKDLTGLKGMLISVTARRGTDMQQLLQKLYQFTPLQSTYSSNMNILVNDLPKVLGVHKVIEEWIAWRRESIKRAMIYDIQKMSKKLHLLRGLEKVLLDIDRAIEIIRYSEEKYIIQLLIDAFSIDEVQANEVADMKLRHINREYIIKRIKDIAKLEEDINEYKEIVESEKRLNLLIINGLEETKEKFGKARKTKIIEISNAPVIRLEQPEVESYPVTIHLTKDGYAYKFKGNQQPTLKPGDEVLRTFETTNDAMILVFLKDAVAHKFPISKIEETRAGNLGSYIPALLRDNDIEIVSYSVLDDKHKILIAAYTNNRIVKIDLSQYDGSRWVIKNAYRTKGQDLLDLITLKEDTKLKLTTDRIELEIDTAELQFLAKIATGNYQTRKGTAIKIELA